MLSHLFHIVVVFQLPLVLITLWDTNLGELKIPNHMLCSSIWIVTLCLVLYMSAFLFLKPSMNGINFFVFRFDLILLMQK